MPDATCPEADAQMLRSSRRRLLGVSALFLTSGATALIYQITWARDLSLIFGASHRATSIVLASFMAGLALGAVSLGRRSQRVTRPLRLYGLLEIGIALAALALPAWLSGVDALYVDAARRAGRVTAVVDGMRIALSFCALLIPTLFMGATLPLLSRHLVSSPAEMATRVSWLYGINTLGAVLGVLGAGFLLVPELGVRHTQRLAVAINLAVGAVAVLFDGLWPGRAAAVPPQVASAPGGATDERELAGLRLSFWGTGVAGACALALEVLWTRSLTIAVGATTYSFTVMLAAFLCGIALGGWIHASRPLRHVRVSVHFGSVMMATGIASALVAMALSRAPGWVVAINLLLYEDTRGVAPGTALLLGFSLMLIPCTLMGIAFPLASQARERLLAATGRAGRYGASVGDTLGLNTAGSIAGSLLAGFALIPVLGLHRGALLVAGVYLAWGALVLSVALAPREARHGPLRACGTALLAAGCLLVPQAAPRWDTSLLGAFQNNEISFYVDAEGEVDLSLARNREVLYYEEGKVATVSVLEHEGVRALLMNGKAVATTLESDLQIELLLGHLPALLHEDPRSALVVGLGTGISLGSVAAHASVQRLVLVEIEEAVLDGAVRFGDLNNRVLEDPRVEVVIQDGRNYLKTTPERFDLITADPIHPWTQGAGYLYTEEYFQSARSRLADGGLMCQWLPAYGLAVDDLRSVLATFARSFPHVTAWQAPLDLILIGSEAPLQLEVGELARRLQRGPVREMLSRVGLAAPYSLLAALGLSDTSVRDYARGAIINTDDNLYIEYSSPLHIGRSDRHRILAEIDAYDDDARASIASYAPQSRQLGERWLRRHARARRQTAAVLRAAARAGRAPRAQRLREILGELPTYGPARVQLAGILFDEAMARLEEGRSESALTLLAEAAVWHPESRSIRSALARPRSNEQR